MYLAFGWEAEADFLAEESQYEPQRGPSKSVDEIYSLRQERLKNEQSRVTVSDRAARFATVAVPTGKSSFGFPCTAIAHGVSRACYRSDDGDPDSDSPGLLPDSITGTRTRCSDWKSVENEKRVVSAFPETAPPHRMPFFVGACCVCVPA